MPLSETPLPGHPVPVEVPEVVQEWPMGLMRQHQGERPHQVIHPRLSRELLQCSAYLLLGSRLVPQDLIHLRGRVW